MDENHQDKARSRLITTEDKLLLPLLSPQDQKKLVRLRKDRKKPLIVVGISAAFVGVMVLIYKEFSFNWPWWVRIPLILIGIVLLILLIRVGYTTQWTGLKGKTLWDWLNLLGTLAIPLVVVGATIGFGWWQGQGALDQQRATILQTYMDNMQDLLFKYNLLGESPTPTNSSDAATIQEVRELARARTLTALRGLDPQRKGILLQFLYDAHLIGFPDTVFDSKTKKTVWVRHPAVISLGGEGTNSADLSDVDLSFTILSDADLSGANLILADLSGADFSQADLFGANLSGANLSGANLSGANLILANLSGADLSFANLSGVDLSGANLCQAKEVTQEQLQSALSLKGATMPDCTKHP
jgi:Pentapeptide repeats (8 copies)